MAIPNYAQGVPRNRLVQITCRGKCGKGRYAEVTTGDKYSLTSASTAKCLVCGYTAIDPYNWILN
jgi:hypothetical protein